MAGRLLFFFGTECTHCHDMDPLVDKLEKELKIKVEKLETWHNAKNAALLEKCDTVNCGCVPFFYNEKTKKAICGAVDYAMLKKWAQG
mgnify:FL=1